MERAILVCQIEAQKQHVSLLKRLPRNKHLVWEIDDATEELHEMEEQLGMLDSPVAEKE